LPPLPLPLLLAHHQIVFSGVGFYRMAGSVLQLPTASSTTAAHVFVTLFFFISAYFSSKMVRRSRKNRKSSRGLVRSMSRSRG
jgi:hypothetical protein